MKTIVRQYFGAHSKIHTSVIAILLFVLALTLIGAPADKPANSAEPTKLAVIWSSGDPYVAHRVCLMYTHAAKRNQWFDEVKLIIWGPSAKLFVENEDLQNKIADMQKDGVIVQACISCANAYGVTDDIRKHGIEVKGMGKPLTEMLQSDWKVLTF